MKNIREVTEPLKEEILKGNVHTIDGMKVWLQALGYSDAIKDATINVILHELADVANTLKKQGVIAVYEEVVKYCLFRGLSYDEACIVAKAFSQKFMLKKRGTPDFNAYWKNVNDLKWENMP